MRIAEHTHNHLTVKDYDYQTYSVDFKKMREDLLYTGSALLVLGCILVPLLIIAWFQDQSFMTLIGFWLGGILGLIPPRLGLDKLKIAANFDLAEHFTPYENKLQVVIWKFRNHAIVSLMAVPYFLWIFLQTFNNNLIMGGNLGNAFAVTLLSALSMFGFVMGLLNLQVRFEIDKEIKRNKKNI